jgi:hypothetical protein
MEQFTKLICGNGFDEFGDYGKIIKNLSKKLDLYINFVGQYEWSTEKAFHDIPFYGRNILETSMTVLLGKIDPFRVITIYKVQSDTEYSLGKKSSSAIEWYGDIIGSLNSGKLWDCSKKKDFYERALLGNHFWDVIWKPALINLLDYVNEKDINSDWLSLIKSEDEESNFARFKADALRLFSLFSKGIHSECLIEIEIMLDEITLKSSIKDVIRLCSTLGLLSNFIGYLLPNVSKNNAIELFQEIEEVIKNV